MICVRCKVYEKHRLLINVVHHRRNTPFVPKIGDGQTSAGCGLGAAGSRVLTDVFEFAVSKIQVKQPRLSIRRSQMRPINLGINVPVSDEDAEPPAVVYVEEHGAPTQVLSIEAKTGVEDSGSKSSVSVVQVERRDIVRKICLEYVGPAVAVVISYCRSHASLFAAVFVVGHAGIGSYIREGSIPVVAIENAWSSIAGDIDIRPAIAIVVERGDTQAVMPIRVGNATYLTYIFKLSSAEIVIEDVRCIGQPARSAHDRRAFPDARETFTRLWQNC